MGEGVVGEGAALPVSVAGQDFEAVVMEEGLDFLGHVVTEGELGGFGLDGSAVFLPAVDAGLVPDLLKVVVVVGAADVDGAAVFVVKGEPFFRFGDVDHFVGMFEADIDDESAVWGEMVADLGQHHFLVGPGQQVLEDGAFGEDEGEFSIELEDADILAEPLDGQVAGLALGMFDEVGQDVYAGDVDASFGERDCHPAGAAAQFEDGAVGLLGM